MKISFFVSPGISGAVGCLRLIYYACIVGGRLDKAENIKRERELEAEDIKVGKRERDFWIPATMYNIFIACKCGAAQVVSCETV